MAFPATKLGLMVELALGADLGALPSSWGWEDITRYVRFADGITISRGRSDEFSTAAPSKATLTLLNDGRFVVRNPVGAYYGTIAKNTPLRVLVRPDVNTASDDFNRSTANGFGTAVSGGSWAVNGTASEYSTTGSAARLTLASAATRRYAVLPSSYLTFDVTIRIRTAALATGAALSAGVLWHYALSSDNNRYELIFNTDQTISTRAVLRIASVETVGPTVVSGLTHVANTWYRVRIQSTSADSQRVRLKVWLDGTSEPTSWTIHNVLGASFNASAGKIGLTGTRETGNTNANAVIEFDDLTFTDGWYPRHTGYVDEWPTRWNDAGLKQMLAPITASGLLRRLAQGGALSSAIRSGVLNAGTPKAYWPMEDRAGATRLASPVNGVVGMSIAGDLSLGAGQAAGSDPLPTVAATTLLRGSVPAYSAGGQWQVQWLMNIPSAPASEQALLRWTTDGTYPIWQLVLVPGGGTDTLVLRAYNSSYVEQLADPGIAFTGEPYGQQLWFEVTATQSGADLLFSYIVFVGGQILNSGGNLKTPVTVGTVTQAAFGNGAGAAGLIGTTLGHVVVWDDASLTLGFQASIGWAQETSFERMDRLGNQQGVALSTLGAGAHSFAVMGAPTSSTLLTQLREVETAEQGILYDEVDASVTLFCREGRYNQAVGLTLDVSQHQVYWPLEPDDNDQQLHNDVTSQRTAGSSYRAQDRTSALAVTAVGFYSSDVTVNLAYDSSLQSDAWWRVHLGTVDEIRYPTVPIDLNRNPGLIPAWLAMNIGNRLQVTNVPDVLTPDVIDLIMEGSTERLDTERWTAELNTSSARPWNVFTIQGGTNRGRLGSRSSTLHAGYASGVTSIQVDVVAGKRLWNTGTVAFDIDLAGEQVGVTNISGSSSPQTFTVVRSKNSVIKAQLINTVVKLWRGSGVAL